MQPRLTRSTNEKMIAGVCGGLGDYFVIDPVIVRLIFVLVTLTSGMGLPVYIILWIVMPRPKAATGLQQPFQPDATQAQARPPRQLEQVSRSEAQYMRGVMAGQPQQQVQQRVAQPGRVQPQMPPDAYPSDMQAAPAEPALPPFHQGAVTGATVRLPHEEIQVLPPAGTAADSIPQRQRRNWRTLGIILVGIGGLVLLEQLTGSSMAFVFPFLLIASGIVLLGRGRKQR